MTVPVGWAPSGWLSLWRAGYGPYRAASTPDLDIVRAEWGQVIADPRLVAAIVDRVISTPTSSEPAPTAIGCRPPKVTTLSSGTLRRMCRRDRYLVSDEKVAIGGTKSKAVDPPQLLDHRSGLDPERGLSVEGVQDDPFE